MASSCRCNVNFARKCSLTHLQAQRKFTSAGCHPQVGTAIQYSIYVPYVRTIRLYNTSVQCGTRTVLHCTSTGTSTVYTIGMYTQYMYMYRYTSTVRVYSARRICQTVELLRQRKKAAQSCNGNLRRMPFRDVNYGIIPVLVSCVPV